MAGGEEGSARRGAQEADEVAREQMGSAPASLSAQVTKCAEREVLP